MVGELDADFGKDGGTKSMPSRNLLHGNGMLKTGGLRKAKLRPSPNRWIDNGLK